MPTVSIVGGETPLGREVRDGLSRSTRKPTVQMLGATDEASGILTAEEGDAVLMSGISEPVLRASDVVISVAGPAPAATVWEHLENGGPPLIDIRGSLESHPAARLRCPLTEPENYNPGSTALSIIAHPAASVLALLLSRLHRAFPVRHTVVQVFEPASERGPAGLSELQQQVTALLSFRPLDKAVFDAQLAFNMLARYGDEASSSLREAEARISRHLTTLLAGTTAMPSLRLVQAPVFHGHTFSIWTEFESRPSPSALEEAIATAQIDVRGADLEPPSNAGVAGQSGLTTGMVEEDRNHPRGMWLWAAADNYQVAADNAVALAIRLLG